jgi:hypothetical protein
MGLPQLDVVPEKYTYKYKPMQYWKDEWFKPIKIKESDLINDVQMWDLKNIGVDLKPSIIPIKKN